MSRLIKTSALKAGLLFSVLTAFFLLGCQPEESGQATVKQSVYQRVLDAGEIRASYAVYPPYAIKDANTGELSGIFVETLNEIGKRLNLKVTWVEPVGWGEIFQGLNSDRHDIFGAGLWRNASRGKVGDFSDPLFYNPIYVYGLVGDRGRFKSLEAINKKNIRISVQDGAAEDLIAVAQFSNAQPVSVTQLNPWTDVLLNITSGKADLTFAEPSAVNLFLAKNPGKLVNLMPSNPIRVYANAYAFKHGEPAFKAMLNAAIEEIRNDGILDKIIDKYEINKGDFVRPGTR